MERLASVFSDVLGTHPGSLSAEDSMTSVPQWDSVGHIQLMLALEEEFDIQFTAEELASLTSIGAILGRLEDKTDD